MAADPYKFDGVLDPWKASKILPWCPGSVLDVGCNDGALVAHLNAAGQAAEGVDASAELIAAAQTRHPQGRFHCAAGLYGFDDKCFDTVVAWNVLEHIADDRAALRDMVRIARRYVVISVPKEDEISLPYSRVTYRPYVDPTHLHYYTQERLAEMLVGVPAALQFEDTTRVRPALAYERIGAPLWLCRAADALLWALSSRRQPFFANLMLVVDLAPPVAGP